MARSAEKGKLPTVAGSETELNEQHDPSGRMDTRYRKCRETLERLHPSELHQRAAFINRATADLGLHADRLREQTEEVGAFSMDLYPRILRPTEWERIQAGVMQRAAAFSAYIRDIYHGREILHAGIIPPEIVFEDPAFHPELHGIPMTGTDPVTVGAVDLIRTIDGEWQVLENRFSTPTGISYVVQLRRILAQALPELFEHLPVLPVASFATRLSEALSEQANNEADGQPLVVLLSEGEASRHFFEESFLARHMGIPLARTGDVVVREGKVFLKTIYGLMRIHVIYRRLEPAQLDPVAFATGSESGVPGLIHCARKGTVRVVNAMGCGVADNRALLGYSDEIIRFYTRERPILRTVPTYHGYDLDQRDWIIDHVAEFALKTVCHPETLGRSNPEAYKLFLAGKLQEILKMDSRLIVAQKLPETSRLPVYRDGAFDLESLSLRAFFIGGRNPYVLPGGLTRQFNFADERLPIGRRHHSLKDTWALREHQPKAKRSGRLEPEISIPESPLTSRAAEAFYWIGRYLERARGTARMLNTLDELRWGELAPGERTLYAPLLEAIMEATGSRIRLQKQSGDLSSLINPLMFDPANPASVRSCLALVRTNASSIRSFITPEFWNSIREA
ncbi:MAG TPA: circularly permuted type 2 ATP-grasp protein, partial [Oceanipulchritudo sp.]|nr:circularly permuted type 2 ATP-grasp protein [Oceanipulchritudo sp.]